MTEIEKQAFRELKTRTVEALAGIDLSRYAGVLDTDPRLRSYVVENIGNPDRHNLYELLGVLRFFRLADKYRWSAKAVRNFAAFYEILKFSGMSGRRSYRLTPVQYFQYANIFGFRTEDGQRLCRAAYLFVPRKFSKTTSTAALAVYDLICGDSNAQAYVGANSYEQAKICFDEIRHIMYGLDPRGKHFRVNREKITYKDLGHDSFIRCLTANAKTQDGLNASLVIMDEYAQARNTAGKSGADLKNVLTSSMGARKSPLTMIITTASEVLDGPFFHELEGVKSVLRGELENDTIFASLFLPDVDDREDSPETWAKVQPHIGVTVQPDFYAREWANAQLSAENLLAFRTKLLNVFCTKDTADWITANEILKVSRHRDLSNPKNPPFCMVAVDLSVWDDFSSVCFGIYDAAGQSFHFDVRYFLPEATIAKHHNRDLYSRWVADGHLIALPGDVIDYAAIAKYIVDRNGGLRIVGIGYDPYKSKDFTNTVIAYGAGSVLKGIRQTYANFTGAVESMEIMIKTGRCTFEPNPITAWCFGNAQMDEDRMRNRKPIKKTHNGKIDGAITALMSVTMFNNFSR